MKLEEVMYHHGPCEHPEPTFEEMFEGGDLLHHCQALRESATGMGDPLRHPEVVRGYIAKRLREWREPTAFWDGHVRELCNYALREYHAAPAVSTSASPGQQCHAGFAFSRTGDFSHAECSLLRGHDGAHRDGILDFWWQSEASKASAPQAPPSIPKATE